jgi:dynein heavy chain
VYENILTGPLKPIPSKSHYTFNLRDISKIFQGLSTANVKQCTQPVHVVRMWIHENKRVFGDRLTDNKDRTYLDDMLIDQSEQKFNLQKK